MFQRGVRSRFGPQPFTHRSALVGGWFGIASFSAIFELLLAYTSFSKISALGAFAAVVAGMALLRVGVGELYGDPVDKRVALTFVLATSLGAT